MISFLYFSSAGFQSNFFVRSSRGDVVADGPWNGGALQLKRGETLTALQECGQTVYRILYPIISRRGTVPWWEWVSSVEMMNYIPALQSQPEELMHEGSTVHRSWWDMRYCTMLCVLQWLWILKFTSSLFMAVTFYRGRCPHCRIGSISVPDDLLYTANYK